MDGSTFTVGPNSNLVIDRFVYDPRKKTGELVATFSKGTMRFIGGKLSKNEGGVTVNTPSGALAIRGGMFQGSTSRGVYSFLFGDSLTFRGRNGQTQTVYQTGYSLDLSGGNANVRPTTPEDTNAFMQALSSTGTNFGSAGTGTNGPANPTGSQQLTNIQNGADQEISDANFIMVQTSIQQQLARLNDLKNNTPPPQNNPTNPTGPADPVDPVDPVDPPVKNGGTFTGYASGFLQTGADGKGEPEFLLNGRSQVILDPKGNTVEANINTDHVRVDGDHVKIPVNGWLLRRLIGPYVTINTETKVATNFNLGFFGNGDAAYVDDNTFLALGDEGTTNVVRTVSKYGELKLKTIIGPVEFSYSPPHQNMAYQQVTHTGDFASLPNAPLCSQCNFLKYGFWGSDVGYGNESPTENTDKMGGWWVATNAPVTPNDIPLSGTADYVGSAIGTMAANSEGIWRQGTAQGGLTMDWDFAKRKGRLDITNFGNSTLGYKSFGGKMNAPGSPVDFSGKIRGDGGKGFAAGSFVGPRTGNAPAGVMGNFGVGNNAWKANGVFGGANTRFTPGGPGNIVAGPN